MNKYTELSDFEINKKVAARYYQNKDFIEAYKDVEKVFVDGNLFDPCNNPSDAMPIIIENGISLTLSDDKDEGKWMAFDGDWYDEYSLSRTSVSYGDNYYRIAMVCFLLMKDAENEG
ncbi:phage protein NinX family protein [Providencia rettgeri]